jgi:hypothetical protein
VQPQENGDGIVMNRLEVVAYDVRGQTTTNVYEIPFLSPDETSPPALSLMEISPALGENGKVLLPAGESTRVRAATSDSNGQPGTSSQICTCAPDSALELMNESRCECLAETFLTPDAAGRIPGTPWEFIDLKPTAVYPQMGIGLLRAWESRNVDRALFSALGVTFLPGEDSSAYTVTATTAVSQGPFNSQISPVASSIYDPREDLSVKVVTRENVIPLARMVALYNGKRPEEATGISPPVLTIGAMDYTLEWDFLPSQVNQGTRICLGAQSMAGHSTIQLIEFTAVSEGLLVGVSVLTDEASCTP